MEAYGKNTSTEQTDLRKSDPVSPPFQVSRLPDGGSAQRAARSKVFQGRVGGGSKGKMGAMSVGEQEPRVNRMSRSQVSSQKFQVLISAVPVSVVVMTSIIPLCLIEIVIVQQHQRKEEKEAQGAFSHSPA